MKAFPSIVGELAIIDCDIVGKINGMSPIVIRLINIADHLIGSITLAVVGNTIAKKRVIINIIEFIVDGARSKAISIVRMIIAAVETPAESVPQHKTTHAICAIKSY